MKLASVGAAISLCCLPACVSSLGCTGGAGCVESHGLLLDVFPQALKENDCGHLIFDVFSLGSSDKQAVFSELCEYRGTSESGDSEVESILCPFTVDGKEGTVTVRTESLKSDRLLSDTLFGESATLPKGGVKFSYDVEWPYPEEGKQMQLQLRSRLKAERPAGMDTVDWLQQECHLGSAAAKSLVTNPEKVAKAEYFSIRREAAKGLPSKAAAAEYSQSTTGKLRKFTSALASRTEILFPKAFEAGEGVNQEFKSVTVAPGNCAEAQEAEASEADTVPTSFCFTFTMPDSWRQFTIDPPVYSRLEGVAGGLTPLGFIIVMSFVAAFVLFMIFWVICICPFFKWCPCYGCCGKPCEKRGAAAV
uniref:Uncharacterized protein n=1 Tax=Chromera velia CCMP2878 TaxID=1169474 RepID=A0A0G4GPX3_9ALVE|eukprot:Cvel_22869.t1-p1 / transcript=Cvel_22869.t1 / gene=Cvel_22869 / organism=Chromera_velia_CCMP2878 / gene_product=hypothetical protein / transcript_product=hypothetical protein / location=Cvel_scaffold2295:21759-22844(+) / protein_length=362 / sequence_SO=supercontig / SO=protein_coding / is_pseudo=false